MLRFVTAALRLPGRQAPFARAAEEPFRRRGKDAVRTVVALIVVLLMTRRSEHVSATSLDVFRAFNDLPGGLRPFVQVVYDLASLWAVAVVALAALVAYRWRLARNLVVAAALAWLLAHGLGHVLSDGFRGGIGEILRSGASRGFPDLHLALVTAVVATASPFLGRTTRILSWLLVLVLIPAEMYLGVALPRSAACAVVLGWGVASAVLYAFGSPAGRPTLPQVRQALRELGLEVEALELAPQQSARHVLLLAQGPAGPGIVKVLGRDQAESQLVSKLWRFAWLRESGPTFFLTRNQEVEHQAFTTMIAEQAGVRVPRVLVAGTGGPAAALIAETDVGGSALADLSAEQLTPTLLADAWGQVATLHGARLAHGRLNTEHVRATDRGVVLVSFDLATTHPTPEQRAADVAELLVTLARVVGPQVAVQSAVAALGAATMAEALPMMQPAALSREGRRLAGSGEGKASAHCAAVRSAAAEAIELPEPELHQLVRVRPASLALAVGTVFGVGALLTAVGDPRTVLSVVRHADPTLLAVAFGLGMLTNLGFALALAGSIDRRIPFWPSLKLQAASAFANLALPFGSQALQIRFLERHGVGGAPAVASSLLNVVGGTLAQVLLLGVLLQTSPQHVQGVNLPVGAVALLLEVLVGVTLLLSLVVLGVPAVRRRVGPPVGRGSRTVLAVARSPRQVGLLIGGNVLAYVLYGLALGASVTALGGSAPLVSLAAANVGVTLVAALVPFPGGGNAVSSVGLAGAILALGVPREIAVGAVLLHQILTSYLPAVPGWLALRSLVRNDDL